MLSLKLHLKQGLFYILFLRWYFGISDSPLSSIILFVFNLAQTLFPSFDIFRHFLLTTASAAAQQSRFNFPKRFLRSVPSVFFVLCLPLFFCVSLSVSTYLLFLLFLSLVSHLLSVCISTTFLSLFI